MVNEGMDDNSKQDSTDDVPSQKDASNGTSKDVYDGIRTVNAVLDANDENVEAIVQTSKGTEIS